MKKISYYFSFCLLVWGLFFVANQVQAQNIGSLKNVVPSDFSFTMDLLPGYTDYQVMQLQKVLNADIDTVVSLEGDGSRGHENKYFGDKTKAAVIKFQEKYRDVILTPSGLSNGTGNVGKATRTKLNLLIGVMTTNESVGSPESRGNNYVAPLTPTNPVVIMPSPAPVTPAIPTSSCDFIELLIDINVIPSSLSDDARLALNCHVNEQNLEPKVDIWVNGEDGTLRLSSPQYVTLSWNSKNVTSCKSVPGNKSKSLSGSQSFYASTTQDIEISCTGQYGSDTDSVSIVVSTNTNNNNNNQASSTPTIPPLSVSCSATPSSIVVGAGSVSWSARVSGGPASTPYTYSWSGSENLVGTTANVLKPYSTAGTKTASVIVTAGSVTSGPVSCGSVSVASPTSYSLNPLTTATNKVLSLSGSSQEMVTVKETSSLSLKRKMTIEAWVKPTSWQTEYDLTSKTKSNVIISKGNLGEDTLEYAFAVDNGKLVFSNKDSGIWTCNAVVPLDTWTHVAVSVDETSYTTNLFVNGVQMTGLCQGKYGVSDNLAAFNKINAITEFTGKVSASSSTQGNTSGKNIHIGNFYIPECNAEDSQNGFVGKIDDVRIWNIARSAADILANATSSVASTTGLVAEYTFDDYSARDITTNANHGFQKGGAQFIEDKTSPSFVVSSTSGTSYSSYYSSSSFTDPDGVCLVPEEEMPTEEGGAGPDRFFSFGGIVTDVDTCNGGDGIKLWKVEIAPCHAGDNVSVQDLTGMTSYDPGYIVIRDGYQKVPSVGSTVLGTAVDDMGLKCSNGGSKYIGTVTGKLGTGNGADCDAAAKEEVKKVQEAKGERGVSFEWTDFTNPISMGAKAVEVVGHGLGLW